MNHKPLTTDEISDLEEGWAKFAVLFREKAPLEDIADAAERFIKRCRQVGPDRFNDTNGFTTKQLELLGPKGMMLAAIGMAEGAVKAKRVQEMVSRVVEGLSNFSLKLDEIVADMK